MVFFNSYPKLCCCQFGKRHVACYVLASACCAPWNVRFCVYDMLSIYEAHQTHFNCHLGSQVVSGDYHLIFSWLPRAFSNRMSQTQFNPPSAATFSGNIVYGLLQFQHNTSFDGAIPFYPKSRRKRAAQFAIQMGRPHRDAARWYDSIKYADSWQRSWTENT